MPLSLRVLKSLSDAKGSFKAKLVLSFSGQLAVAFAILLASTLILDANRTRRDLRTVQDRLKNHILSTGKRLVTNESILLKPLIEANSTEALREVVINTILNDSDIVYGIYMDADAKPWVLLNSRDTLWNALRGRPLRDSMSIWAAGIERIEYKDANVNGADVIEFACPVNVGGKKAGTIRFGFSTALMYAALADAAASADHSRKQTLYILLSIGFVTFLIAAGFSRVQAEKITKPIISLTNAARDLADRDYQAEIKIDEEDETGILAEVFEGMRAKIRDYMDNLQTLVEEKVQQIRDIMENIDQGLFTFDLNLKINPDHSQKAKEVLRVEALSETTLAQILRLTSRQEELFRDWVFVLQRDFRTQKWSYLAKLAPVQEMTLGEGDEARQVKLDYRRILNRQGGIGKIMVLAQDVTEARRTTHRQQEEKVRSEDRVKIILGVASYPQETIHEFLRDTAARIHALQKRIEEIPRDDYEAVQGMNPSGDGFAWVAPVFRNCHTIKGNAGAFGFDALAAVAEKLENRLQSLKVEKSRRAFRPAEMRGLLSAMMEELQKVNEVYLTISGNVDEVFLRLPEKNVARIVETAALLNRQAQSPEMARFLESCKQMSFQSLESLARKYRDLTARIGNKVGKDVIFETVPKHQEIDPTVLYRIDEALVHLIRNAMAHGMESKGEKRDPAKGPGRIELSYGRAAGSHVFKVSDNGKGVDREALVNKAVFMGILTKEASQSLDQEEMLDLIFQPGLSTNSTIDTISGRGLGLAIVAENVKAGGGTLSVESRPGLGTSVTISLPV
ncbi:MAG: Signal transduction histidine kinase CheA [Fibrobacteres bacterium]|nr:Signal transduction histidine kinase CheA [Fibrobacterota bacterium]